MSRSQSSDGRKAFVVGVTGSQGGATARHLLSAGWQVRGLTRDSGSRRARAVAAEGVELVQGDLDDRAKLTAAMADVDGVYGVTPMDPKGYSADLELRQGTLIAEAAVDAAVPHLVFSSVSNARAGTGLPHIEVKGLIEDRIHELDVPATILRPTVFMDNLVSGIAPMYWRLAPAVIGWDTPLAWVAADDVGAVAAQALQNRDRWAGRTLEMVGDRRSLGEARQLYMKVRGRRPFRLPMPVWAFRLLVGEELILMWEWQGSGEFGVHSHELDGMPVTFTGLEGFLQRWAAQNTMLQTTMSGAEGAGA